MHTKTDLSTSRHSEVRTLHTYRQTDAQGDAIENTMHSREEAKKSCLMVL